jgi:DNA-binding CsgD family transcriptional regulator
MVERKRCRSDLIQHLFCEISFPIEMLEGFCNDDSIYKRLNPHAYNEQIADLEEQLRKEFWRVIGENLTDRQREVVELLASGYTQQETAKQLGINQSSVSKALIGSQIIDNNHKTIYGGIKLKIKRAVKDDKRINEILQQISDLRNESWL